jgi:hypothetical protein
VPQIVIDLIELAVGLACLAGAVAAWRRGLRLAGIVLAIAGMAAAGHAILSLSEGGSR